MDSEDETLREDSEIALKQELAWASHLSLQVKNIQQIFLFLFQFSMNVASDLKYYSCYSGMSSSYTQGAILW